MNNRVKTYVYIAGPYSQGDVAVNVANAIRAADELAAVGLIPFVPHLTHFWHLLCPHNIAFWYDYDLAWVDFCDCLVRLPGKSTGADKEVERARKWEMPIYDSVGECVRAMQEQGVLP